MFPVLCGFLTANSCNLGRCNPSLLSETQLLELLVADFADNASFLNEAGDFPALEKWEGVELKANRSVKHIRWSNSHLNLPFVMLRGQKSVQPGGSIDFQWVPPQVTECTISWIKLEGTLETAVLPLGLEILSVPGNRLSGTFETAGLPRSLRNLSIGQNKFEGPFDLAALPREFKICFAGGNRLSGTLDFSGLPKSVETLSLAGNHFMSPLCLRAIDKALRLDVTGNAFDQDMLHVGVSVFDAKDMHFDREQFGEIVYRR